MIWAAGHRSVERDVEAQVLLATTNADLQARMGQVRTFRTCRTSNPSPFVSSPCSTLLYPAALVLQEQERLYSFASPVTRAGIEASGRKTVLWVRIATAIIRRGF